MNREEFEALDKHIEARAVRMWTEAGSPDGGHARFLDQVRELVSIEEVEPPCFDPREAALPVVEEASIQENLGEFPTLRDQGDEMTFPDPDPQIDDDLYAEDDVRLRTAMRQIPVVCFPTIMWRKMTYPTSPLPMRKSPQARLMPITIR